MEIPLALLDVLRERRRRHPTRTGRRVQPILSDIEFHRTRLGCPASVLWDDDEAFGGAFLCKPKLRAFSFFLPSPNHSPSRCPFILRISARKRPPESGLMSQPSSAFGSAGDGRSAGGLSAKPCCDAVRPIRSPLCAVIRKPCPALKPRSAGQTSMPGRLALTAFAADCAVWTNEAFGQSLLARGLTLTGTWQLPPLLCRSRPDSILSKSISCVRPAGGRYSWAHWQLPGNR